MNGKELTKTFMMIKKTYGCDVFLQIIPVLQGLILISILCNTDSCITMDIVWLTPVLQPFTSRITSICFIFQTFEASINKKIFIYENNNHTNN